MTRKAAKEIAFSEALKQEASPSSAPIHVDNLSLEILIIARYPNALTVASRFLKKRGWNTTIATNIGKAVEFIVKNKPDFVLLSFDHPHPSIKNLPTLISQTLNVECVGFTEINDPSTAALISSSKAKHKIFGNPSGPAIHRVLKKIILDICHEAGIRIDAGGETNQGRKQKAQANKEKNKEQEIKDSPVFPQEKVRFNELSVNKNKKGVKQEDAEALIKYIENQEKNQHSLAANSLGKTTEIENKTIYQRAPMKSSDGQRLVQEGPKYKPGAGLFIDPGARKKSKEGLIYQKGLAKRGGGLLFQKGPPVMTKRFFLDKGAAPEKGINLLKGAKPNSQARGQTKEEAKNPYGQVQIFGGNKEAKKSKGGTAQLESAKSEQRFAEPQKIINRELSGAEKALSAAIEKLLAKSCNGQRDESSEAKTAEELGVVRVESEGLNGLIVLCRSLEKVSLDFVQQFKTTLEEEMSLKGVKLSVDEGFVLQAENINFLEWARAQAQIYFVAQHKGEQISVAYLLAEERKEALVVDEKSKMAQISLEEISLEDPVNFDAYIHLKKNDKYVMYLKKGRTLSLSQKDKLNQSQVSALHVEAHALNAFHSYRAACYLMKKIRNFKKTGMAA